MQSPLLEKALARLAGGVDEVFNRAALGTRRDPGQRGLDRAGRARFLALIESFYARPEFLTRDNALFARPAAIAPEVVHVRDYASDGAVLDLRWPSAFEPLWSNAALVAHLQTLTAAEHSRLALPTYNDGHALARSLGIDQSAELRAKYLRAHANQTARARWFKHAGDPRPCVVLIHGYMAGTYAIEERVWPVRRIFDTGCDVVISVLPLHGLRRSAERGYRPPAFPSGDPRFTIEGFRQLVSDHRALFDYLRAGRVTRLGVMGMSLGGYSAALLATLESCLEFAMLLVPLAAIEERGAQLPGDASEQSALREGLRRAYWPISPFARSPLVAAAQSLVIAGEADQVTGLEHGQRLAAHFGAELSSFHGGHLLQLGRDQAFLPVWQRLASFASGGST
jgi:pimeloyl-ACP methyl ester carboxylesterase